MLSAFKSPYCARPAPHAASNSSCRSTAFRKASTSSTIGSPARPDRCGGDYTIRSISLLRELECPQPCQPICRVGSSRLYAHSRMLSSGLCPMCTGCLAHCSLSDADPSRPRRRPSYAAAVLHFARIAESSAEVLLDAGPRSSRSLPMDRAALEHALRSCVTFAPDDEDSLVFILDEACRDVTLASDRTVPASIDELDAHPLTAVLRQYLPDLLNIEPDPLFLFSVFDALHEPPDETPLEAETKHSRRPRACELCGRIMPLTIRARSAPADVPDCHRPSHSEERMGTARQARRLHPRRVQDAPRLPVSTLPLGRPSCRRYADARAALQHYRCPARLRARAALRGLRVEAPSKRLRRAPSTMRRFAMHGPLALYTLHCAHGMIPKHDSRWTKRLNCTHHTARTARMTSEKALRST